LSHVAQESSVMDNVWFIHIPKCGGTSVKHSLDISTGHQTLGSMKESMDEEFYSNAFIFSFVRNPFSRMQSLYKFEAANGFHGGNDVSFNKWLDLTLLEQQFPYFYNETHFANCFDWLTIDGESIDADFVGIMENFPTEFQRLTDILGVNANISHLNRSSNIGCYYTASTIALIKASFYKDIDTWYKGLKLL